MTKVECIGGPMDGGSLEFNGDIPKTYRFPSNVQRLRTDLISHKQSNLDDYLMAEYVWDSRTKKYKFNGYI